MQVVCVKVGTKYGPEYPNRLAAMVTRHAPAGTRILCLTDNPVGVACETAPIGTEAPGWWAKLVLFQPHPALGGERFLYLDLDVVVVRDLEPLLAYAGPFAMPYDWWGTNLQGSVIAADPAQCPPLWDRFLADELNIRAFYHSEQEWLTVQMPDAELFDTVAPGFIGSYKAHSLQAGPGGYGIVCFHGTPKPHECNGWVTRHWQ